MNGIPTRIVIEGMFGLGFGNWPGFEAHAVERDKPFFSETGYRSFLGIHADPCAGLSPDDFCRRVIEQHIAKECKGKLRKWTDWVERRRATQPSRAPERS